MFDIMGREKVYMVFIVTRSVLTTYCSVLGVLTPLGSREGLLPLRKERIGPSISC